MQPKTEEFLQFMLWSADQLIRPTYRNLTDSFECWAYRNGFMRQVATLKKQRLLEADPQIPHERLYRLTEQGRLHALGGRDPEIQWSRAWDGRWRLVLFDLPTGQNARRERLWRYLRSRCFGFLQNSVWITPDPMREQQHFLEGARVNVESLILLDARPCAGETDAEIVDGAWDFARINRRYERHRRILKQRPAGSLQNGRAANALRRWATEERDAWLKAVEMDPLLPERLLPEGYLGRCAWEERKKTLKQAGRQLRTYGP